MRIAIVTDYNNRTGIGKQNYHLYRGLNALGVETDIINLVSPQGFKTTPEYGINIISCSFLVGSLWNFKKQLRKILIQNKYDFVLYGHQGLSYLYSTASGLGIPQGINVFDLFTFYSEYAPWWDPRFWIFNTFFLKNVGRFQNIAFDSGFAQNDYVKFFGIKDKHMKVIPIGFDREESRNTKEPNDVGELLGKKIILHVGSEEKRKNIGTFFEISKLYALEKDILFVRIGKMSKESKRKMSSGDYPNVRYFSNISEAELHWFYSHATLFLFTSFHEGYGMPIVEAYSNDLPIISSKISDMVFLFKDDPNVFFVNDTKNAQEYKEKIDPLLNGDICFIKQDNFPVPDTQLEAKMYLSFMEENIV